MSTSASSIASPKRSEAPQAPSTVLRCACPAIPPRSGMLEKSREYANAAARVAKDLEVPLCDYFAECLKRRPEDWDGAAKKFEAYEGYEVPTLISRDGVHPSNPRKHVGDYSEEGRSRNGFVLRNFVALRSYAEVIREALEVRRK